MTTHSDQLLPHDMEAEEAVIGSMLIDADVFPDIAALLRPDDFYRDRHKLCFEAALSLFNRSQAIDQVTLAGELARANLLEAAGVMAYCPI